MFLLLTHLQFTLQDNILVPPAALLYMQHTSCLVLALRYVVNVPTHLAAAQSRRAGISTNPTPVLMGPWPNG